MRRLVFGALVVCSAGTPRTGYNVLTQPFVIRRQGIPGDESHQIMYGQVDKCQEFFLIKDLVNDEDRLVEFVKQTDIVSCTEPNGSAEIIDAYGIKGEFVCSQGSSHRAMAVSCSAGSSPFGGFIIFLGDEQECVLENAVNRCGGAFVKFREITKGIHEAVQETKDNLRTLEEENSSESTGDGSESIEESSASSTSEEYDQPIESDPVESDISGTEPQAFEIIESIPANEEGIESS